MARGRKAPDDAAAAERAAALDALQATRNIRLEVQSGYPAVVDGVTIPGWVVVADVDLDGAPDLRLYRWPNLLRWHRADVSYLQDHSAEVDIVGAMDETEPDGIGL